MKSTLKQLKLQAVACERILTFGVLMMAFLALFGCNRKNDKASVQNIAIIFNPQVEEVILGSTNHQINTMTLVGFKGKSVDIIQALNPKNVYWLSDKSNWKEFDSLLVFANMRENDILKIEKGMSIEAYQTLSFGGYPVANTGLQPPFLMKGILTQEELKKSTNGNINITMKPMVAYVRFNNSASLAIDKIVIRNIDTTVSPHAIPLLGTYTIEDKPSIVSQFGYYVYPSKNFVIAITKNEKTITQNIDVIQANSLLEIDITDSDVPQQQGYKFYINNQLLSVENGDSVSLPDNGGYLYASLDNHLDIQLQNAADWIRIYTPSFARSTNATDIVAKIATPVKLVASFRTGVMYQEVASTQYIFDAYYVLNTDRKTVFNIIEKSSQQVVASIEGIQKGEGNIAINSKNVEGKKITLAQQGGEEEFVVKSSSNHIEIIAPVELKLIDKQTITETGDNFEYSYKYKVEPTTSATEVHFLLIAKDNSIYKADTIHIYQQPLIMSADRQALINIFQKLGGVQWTNNANNNWNTGYPMNEWEGVMVNEDNQVVGLNLKANSNIKGDFPVEITQLLGLQELVIGAGNELLGSIPKEIGNLKSLRIFKTTGNKMTGDLPKEFGSLTKLADMDISKQYHTGKIWKELQVIPAYKDESSFTTKVRTQYVAGTTTEVILPIETADQTMEAIQIDKAAQSYILNLPGDIVGQSFIYSSVPKDNMLNLKFNADPIFHNQNSSVEATFPENTTSAKITYTVNVVGKNNTTGVVGNYTYIIEQTADNTARKDGEVRIFLKSPKPSTYNVVYMADGFILEDLQSGKDYDHYANLVLSHIFSKEPFVTYKDYFNVYVIYVASAQRGIRGKLGSSYDRNNLPYMNYATVNQYINNNNISSSSRLILINDDAPAQGVTANNLNAMFNLSTLEVTALHEFGHTFSLMDEYDGGNKLPYKEYMPNVSNTNDLSKIKWKHFIGKQGYESVGAYEGGLYTNKGIYRPESLSIMRKYNKNHYEFNAPSREAIVKKIKDYAKEPYSFEEFLKLDKPKPQP